MNDLQIEVATALIDKLTAINADLIEALKAIASKDHLLVVSEAVFFPYAARRMQEIARITLAKATR